VPLQGIPSLFGGRRGAAAVGPSSLLTSLQASWKLSDTSDASGNGNTLTNNNTVTFVAGKIGNAAQFVSTSSQSLSIADNSFVTIANAGWTVAFWVNPTSSSNQMWVAKDNSGADREFYIFWVPGSGFIELAFFVLGNTLAGSIDLTVTINTGTWYCVIAKFDPAAGGGTLYLKVNDSTGSTSPGIGSTGATETAAQFTIGQRQTGASPFYSDALIDDVNIWHRTLSAAEETCFYNGGTGTEYPFTGLCT